MTAPLTFVSGLVEFALLALAAAAVVFAYVEIPV